jgi:AhpD family alkylhydroperoxidase
MNRFDKRIYYNLHTPARDAREIASAWRNVRRLNGSASLEPSFRERLMLAVTGVNQCRYCSFVHSRMALEVGVAPDQLHNLADQDLEGCPEDEVTALLYAQHWAESQGQPDPAARQRLIETYGPERSQKIEMTLRLIQAANLLGNTFDYLLYRLGLIRS